jgi:plastocyanin
MKKVLILIFMLPLLALAADEEYSIQIKDHRFEPAELTVPANKKIKLVIENKDATPEEFESYELNREKVITGNGKATIYIGPLSPGKYPYFGDFNQATANGIIIAK